MPPRDSPKTDIRHREDIILLVDQFYEKVKRDEKIGFFFNEVVQVHWESHLPKIYSFWEGILFNTGDYHGNPIAVHLSLHSKSPMSAEHFQRWVDLFSETVDEYFDGEMANLIKQRALSISTVMQIKLSEQKNNL